MEHNDITIIGAGVIGLSAAYMISQEHKGVLVVEKNDRYGAETSSRNSEVIHAGLHYPKASDKACTCVRGSKMLYEYCREKKVKFKKTGKIIVACDEGEEKQINRIYDRGRENGVENLRFLSRENIWNMDPDIDARSGLYSADTGIIDSHGLMKALYSNSLDKGVDFAFSIEVIDVDKKDACYIVEVREPDGSIYSFETRILVNAAGLYAERIASMAGINTVDNNYKIHLCKGQYFRVSNPGKYRVNHLIYPTPRGPGLGIHITQDMAGGLRLGPDAEYIDKIDYGVKDEDRDKFYMSVSRFMPALKINEIMPDTSGIRPRLTRKNGAFADFIIKEESGSGFPGFINLIGIESPGLTSCLAIGDMVKEMIRGV